MMMMRAAPAATRMMLCLALAWAGSMAAAAEPGRDLLLSDGWRFIRQDVGAAPTPDFDDSQWQQVTLPHTWNARDAQDGGSNYERGASWYRRRLSVDADEHRLGKRFFLRFEGAATVANVYVNGTPVGEHRGSFTAFCFDITEQLKPGDGNIVAVRVDNSHFADIAPLSGDFSIWGGLYRDVHLLVREPLHISPIDDGSCGVYLRQWRVRPEMARVEVGVVLRNMTRFPRTARMTCTITDADGKEIARGNGRELVNAGASGQAVANIEIDRPRLWNGRQDPYLYTATIEVKDGEQVTDRIVQPLGLRFVWADPNEGFLLNGKPYRLYGVNRHQDRLDKGWAISKADHEEDFKLIEEIGATAVRLAHYPQADYAYTLCDRAGLVVWAELPLVNDITKSQAFADNAKQQLRELIKQNYNHPSIAFWALYNELSLKEPDFWTEQKLITDLNELAKKLDPMRLTAAATHKQALEHPVNWLPDVTAFNRYWGWYYGQPQDWGAGLDEIHRRFPDKRVGISEYGAGASIYQHEATPAKPRTGGEWHPEEWQSICHEQAWIAMRDRPWLFGTFVWNMFDFAADDRAEGDQPGRNDKGLITYDRKIKKDAFFFYKASWRDDEPVVHIASKRFNPRPAGETEIKVYSNCDQVEIFLNGQSLGAKTGEHRIFRWESVKLVDGENEVRAVGQKDAKQHTDTHTWKASPGATTRLVLPSSQ